MTCPVDPITRVGNQWPQPQPQAGAASQQLVWQQLFLWQPLKSFERKQGFLQPQLCSQPQPQEGAASQQVGAGAGSQQTGAASQQLDWQHLFLWQPLNSFERKHGFLQPQLCSQHGAGSQQTGAGSQQTGAASQQLGWQHLFLWQPNRPASALPNEAPQISNAADRVIHFMTINSSEILYRVRIEREVCSTTTARVAAPAGPGGVDHPLRTGVTLVVFSARWNDSVDVNGAVHGFRASQRRLNRSNGM